MRNVLRWILKLGVSAAFLYVLFRVLDTHLLFSHLHDMVWSAVPAVLFFLVVSMCFRAWRFMLVFNSTKHRLTFVHAFNLGLVGETLNMILPGATGDIAKAYYGYKQHNVKEEMISATILDKMIALLGLVLMGLIGAVLYSFTILFVVFLALSLLLCAFVFIPALIPWKWFGTLQKKLRKQWIDMHILEQSFNAPLSLKLVATSLSIIGWLSSFVMLFFITQLFGLHMNLLFLCTVAPLMNLSKLFPLSWSGLGVQEGVTAYLFGLIGVDPSAAVLVSLAYTITATVIPGIFGLGLILYWKERA